MKKRVLERIAAELHSLPNVKVELNKWLPSLINPAQKREIDVLLTVSPVGYEMRIAIECRNLSGRIEAKDIGEFADKLNQVGIQTQGCIFVSASGYRRGAKTRARELGITLLTPLGLTADRLAIAVEEGFQTIVFLQAVVTEWTTYNDLPIARYSELSLSEQELIYDENGNLLGYQFDLIWEKWRYEGIPPSSIGEHLVKLDIRPGWYQLFKGEKVPIRGATAKVLVRGLVISIRGNVEHISLWDALTEKLEKYRLKVTFDPSIRTFPVTILSTEEDFRAFLNQPRVFHIVWRLTRLPRLLTRMGYWPPSKRAVQNIKNLMGAFERGEIPDPRPIHNKDIEGTDLSAVWDEIVDGSPAVERNIKRKPFE
jgi:hypothetical protein